jgi:hypothetical protein
MARTMKSVKNEEDKLNKELDELMFIEALLRIRMHTIYEKQRKIWDRYYDDGMDW